MTIRVLVDACLLIKGNVSNVLFDLANVGLITLHWTPEIAQQFIKNWALARVALEEKKLKSDGLAVYSMHQKALALAAAKNRAQARLSKFQLMQSEWRIPGWDCACAAVKYTEQALLVGEIGGVHQGDYEVALAAIKLKEVFPKDNVWLVTDNIAHLPAKVLAQFKVWSLHQGLLLEELDEKFPAKVQQAIERTMSDSQHPKLTKANMLRILSSPREFASDSVKARFQTLWTVSPTLMDEMRSVRKISAGESI